MVLGSGISSLFYRAALICAFIHYALAVGRPKFSREWVTSLASNDSAHYMAMCLLFLPFQPVFMVLVPMLVGALYTLVEALRAGKSDAEMTAAMPEFLRAKLVGFDWSQAGHAALTLMGAAEANTLFFLVILVLTGGIGFLQPFVFYQIIKLRYKSNFYTKQAFTQYARQVETLLQHRLAPGFLSTIYFKIKNMLG